jgi:uncharacterized protein YoxC
LISFILMATVPSLPGPLGTLPLSPHPGLASTLLVALQVPVQAQVPEWRLWLATLTDIATVIIAFALLVTVVILLVIALQVRKLVRKVDPLLKQVRSHVDPVMGHVRDVGENVNYMSSAVRADVQQVTEMIDGTRRRLNVAAEAAEHRIREFNALLGVMQEEAERIFIDTASTARGVRAGTETYRSQRTTELRIEPKE